MGQQVEKELRHMVVHCLFALEQYLDCLKASLEMITEDSEDGEMKDKANLCIQRLNEGQRDSGSSPYYFLINWKLNIVQAEKS